MKKMFVPKSAEEMRKEFPSKLLAAYLKLIESDFSDQEHKKYDKLAREFLGKNAEDGIARGALVVRLCVSTMDLKHVGKEKVSKKVNKKAEKKSKVGPP